MLTRTFLDEISMRQGKIKVYDLYTTTMLVDEEYRGKLAIAGLHDVLSFVRID
jgi:hypothetical protein